MRTLGRHVRLRLLMTLAASLIMSCGGAEQAREQAAAGETTASGKEEVRGRAAKGAAEPAAAPGYRVIDVTDGGTIRGVVRFIGTAPPARLVRISEDVEACGATRQVQTVRLGPKNGLADALVSLTDIQEGAALVAPDEPPVLDQTGCRFVPHLLLVPARVPVNVLNSDPITHNIHTLAFDNRPINRAQPSFMKKMEVSFKVPEKVKVNCDIHEWMGAWIAVMGHPYYAKTRQDGSFSIPNVPAGTYTLELWHETLGTTTQEVTVAAGEVTEVSFGMSPQA